MSGYFTNFLTVLFDSDFCAWSGFTTHGCLVFTGLVFSFRIANSWFSWVFPDVTSGFVGRGVTLLIYSGYATTVFDFVCWNSDFTARFINGYTLWSCTSPVSIFVFLNSNGLLVGVTFWRIRDFQSISTVCWRYVNGTIVLRCDGWSSWLHGYG